MTVPRDEAVQVAENPADGREAVERRKPAEHGLRGERLHDRGGAGVDVAGGCDELHRALTVGAGELREAIKDAGGVEVDTLNESGTREAEEAGRADLAEPARAVVDQGGGRGRRDGRDVPRIGFRVPRCGL